MKFHANPLKNNKFTSVFWIARALTQSLSGIAETDGAQVSFVIHLRNNTKLLCSQFNFVKRNVKNFAVWKSD